MKTVEMLDKCKEKLGVTSDYALAKALDIPRMRISDYRLEKKVPDEYTCFKFAEVLGESPSYVIAQIQAENAKDKNKALFFKSFLTAVGLWIILAVIPVFSDSSLGNVYAGGNSAETRASSALQNGSLYET